MTRKLWKQPISVGILCFLVSWMLMSCWRLWTWRNFDDRACLSSMRFVYLATKRLPAKTEPNRIPNILAHLLLIGFIPTRSETKWWTNGIVDTDDPPAIRQMQSSLLCTSDPRFPVKRLMSRTDTLDFKPSYEIFPDAQIAVYCPFHHQAITMDGHTISRP